MQKTCSVDGCDNKLSRDGVCRKHYSQVCRFGKIIPEEKFIELLDEIWKDIDGYNGRYQVSNFGRVRSFINNKWGIKSNPSLLKFNIESGGYEFVTLMHNGKRNIEKAHRLVAKTFIPNPENKCDVNHIDGDKRNNRVDNLEWVTKKENIEHSIHVLGNRPGRWHEKPVVCIETGKKYRSSAQAGRELNINRNNILKVVSDNPAYRHYKTCGGYHWKLAD